MNRNKALLYIQSVLSIVIAVMLITATLSIYREGLSLRADDPMAVIYTVDGIIERLRPVIPVFIAVVIVTVINAFLGVNDDRADRAVLNIDIKPNTATAATHEKHLHNLRLLILLISIVCIVIGIFNGSMMDVFVKASRICTECIGLG